MNELKYITFVYLLLKYKISLSLLAALSEKDLPAVGKLFSAYLNIQTQSITLFHELSTNEHNATAMNLTISSLSMKSNLDGIEAKLIQRIEVLNFGIEFDSIIVNKDTSVEHNQITNELLMKFDKQELIVINETAVSKFAANLVLKNNVSIMIEGSASALAKVIIGNITITNISVSDTFDLIGYDRFDSELLTIDEIDLIKTLSSHELSLSVRAKVNNPSVLYILNGGCLSLDLRELTSGISLGLVIIDSFYLATQTKIQNIYFATQEDYYAQLTLSGTIIIYKVLVSNYAKVNNHHLSHYIIQIYRR
ncbi:unnamed protein product [Rotaria sp. Silwood1]|nr:unnamed protein product [Rotaria sp. Silwood1]